MTYLITGGAGFIGSHIAEELAEKGEDVIILDNLETGNMSNIAHFKDKITFINGDIRDSELLKKITKDVDFICHQAALRSVPKSMENPLPYFDVNITGMYNVLEAARLNEVKGISFASSSSVYGDTNIFPQKEIHTLNPQSPYSLTKLTGEHLCRFFHKTYGLNAVSLRYFNVFGPRQSIENKYAVVVPIFIKRVLNKQSPTIYGDGKQSRDFTYVKEVVKANLLAVQSKNNGGEVFNVAEGKSITIHELHQEINKILGEKTKPTYEPARLGDVFKSLGCPDKAKEKLGFSTSTGFEDGLKITIDWFKNTGE